jgi:hypothetical protein
MLAAYHGHAPLVKLLLEHGADPNALNDRGQSPLAGAVFKGEKDVVEVSYFRTFLLRLSALYLQKPCPVGRSSKGEQCRVLMIYQALLDGGADPDHGSPSAMEAIVLFKQEEKWRGPFEAAPGKGKAKATS